MDLRHILQPQSAHGRSRTPKRPSLPHNRPSAAGAQRHSTLSSEPQQSHSTPPASRVLPAPTPSRQTQEAWLNTPFLRSNGYAQPAEALPPHRDESDATSDIDEETSSNVSLDSNEQRFATAAAIAYLDREDGDSEDEEEEEEEEDEDEEEEEEEEDDEDDDDEHLDDDAFSLEFTLDSDSSHGDNIDDFIYDLADPSLDAAYQLDQPQPYPHPSQPHSQISTSASEPIDLTNEPPSPLMQRSALSEATSAAGPSRKRDRDQRQESTSSPHKRRRTSQGPSTVQDGSQPRHVEEIDLIGSDDEDGLAKALSKQREDQVKAQVPTPSAPTKLQELQCTVCLDNPTDLTATVCGHAFCRKCLLEWLIAGEKEHPRRSNCPACRKPLKRSAKHDTIPLEIMVKPRAQVRLTARRRDDQVASR